jgi:hypothetical protein
VVRRRAAHVAHLVRRFARALSSAPPATADEAWAADHLLPGELALWRHMSNPDRRHAIDVARRFATARPQAVRAEMAAALLHDVGKVRSGLGTGARVVATVVGPRTPRFRLYHDHEQLGVGMLRDAGSDPVTISVLVGESAAAAAALLAADEI